MAEETIRVILCGKIPSHQQAVTEKIKPRFEVVQICDSIETLQQTVNDYFTDGPSTEKPQIIVMGGGFSQAEYETAVASSPAIRPSEESSSKGENSCQVAWLRPAHFAPGASGQPPAGGPPPAGAVAERISKRLAELASDGGHEKGRVYYF